MPESVPPAQRSRGPLATLLAALKPALQPRPGLDGTSIEIAGPDGPLTVSVAVHPRARRILLRIDRRSGAPQLTLPRGIGRIRAERFLVQHAGWIAARLKALPDRVRLIDGATFPFRGEPTRIVHSQPFRGGTRLVVEDGQRLLRVHGAENTVESRVLRFLKAEALAALAPASARYAARAGVTIGRVSIKDTRSRWGSCSAKGDLAYSWRLILAPAHVLDYLAAHEVAHRLEMNHSARYWRHVQAICPEYRAAEEWLRRQGSSLHHYGP